MVFGRLVDAVPVDAYAPREIGGCDGDGFPDLMVKFNMAQVKDFILGNINIINRFTTVTLTLTVKLNDGTQFQAVDNITVIWNPPRR